MRRALLTSALAGLFAAGVAPAHNAAEIPAQKPAQNPAGNTPPPLAPALQTHDTEPAEYKATSASLDRALLRHLARLQQANARLRERLPSFSCHETFTSTRLHNGKLREQKTGEAEMRALRLHSTESAPADPENEASGPLHESLIVKTLNGKPQKPNAKLKLPLNLHGGFADALSYFSAGAQSCLVYKLGEDRITFYAPDPPRGTDCESESTTEGFAQLDPAGHVTYIERRVLKDSIRNDRRIPFASITFRQVQLGDQTFTLSSHLVGEVEEGDDTARFEADFTDCRLFHATATLETDSTRVVDHDTQDPAPTTPPGAQASPPPPRP